MSFLTAILGLSGRTKRSLVRPPVSESCPDCSVRDTKNFGPLHQAASFTAHGKPYIVGAAISVLFRNSGPSAIRWLVCAVAVYSVNAVAAAGSWTHVLKETLRRALAIFAFKPSVTDNNSAGAVAVVPLVFLVVAPATHASQDNSINHQRAALLPFCVVPPQAAAATNGTTNKVADPSNFRAATVTSALPVAFPSTPTNQTQKGKPSKFVANLEPYFGHFAPLLEPSVRYHTW